MSRVKSFTRLLRDFATDARAAVTVEMVLILPLLIWAFFATMIFNDAYRVRTLAQSAALHVADAISRSTTILTEDYLEGMNDVYDFLLAEQQTSRLRITSVAWDRDADRPMVLWSHGTRGMNPLPENAFELLASDDLGVLRELMDGEDGTDLIAGFTQMPNVDLHNRIPPVMPGEALILVESFTMWETPLRGVFLGFDILDDTRLSPIAVVRPRFSPFINFEGAIVAAPPDANEFAGPDVEPGTGDEEEPEEPTEPDGGLVIVDNDFTTNDTDGWSQTTVTSSSDGSIGRFLGPFGGETHGNPVTFEVDLGREMVAARIEFDLYLLDSWDGYDPNWSPDGGEQLWIGVDGTSIAAEAFQVNPLGIMRAARDTTASREEGEFRTRMELVGDNMTIGGSGWSDQAWRVTIDITDPNEVFDLGFQMLSDEARDNESFGIDNFRISATAGTQTQGHFIPSQTKINTDPFSGFQKFRGCPEPRLAARTHHVTQSALEASGSSLRHRVQAGGRSDLTACNGFDHNDYGYVNANPTLLFNWDNENRSGPGNRLRIRTDDGNRGFTCDAILAVRDPGGQWNYNGWTSWGTLFFDDFNARLDLENAQSGTYQVYVGNWYRGNCQTDIIFERY
ncbi:MAG: Tad secretion system protein [Roseibaca calidilacus]|uniref:Tad secretion system protein n=1 Tax=Roseibaca calidilacus TaxID=1666912 RepID=A0A0P7YQR5_9RHOB|nr:hypothetical protein [Roseibaca calidilacus]KPP92634.1 MAG: Tad secretion system protein [Roseibaca calidilacus]CUX80294.1 hypothetical protein Ga0058931_1002 [Roseibaca calidilacus]